MGNHLTKPESDIFFDIYLNLLDYVNSRYRIIPDAGRFADRKNTDHYKMIQVALHIWINHPELLTEYLSGTPEMSQKKQSILRSWRRFVYRKLVIVRHLPSGSVVAEYDNPDRLYLVHGVTQSLEELTEKNEIPVQLATTLLPFEGRIITDGLLAIDEKGTDEKYTPDYCKEIYQQARLNGTILTEL
ncbi:MAG: hypothetical protein IJ242_10745 [Clostridia bacterium]|nr:hypothetical protein [Clostridia bacterium]